MSNREETMSEKLDRVLKAANENPEPCWSALKAAGIIKDKPKKVISKKKADRLRRNYKELKSFTEFEEKIGKVTLVAKFSWELWDEVCFNDIYVKGWSDKDHEALFLDDQILEDIINIQSKTMRKFQDKALKLEKELIALSGTLPDDLEELSESGWVL